MPKLYLYLEDDPENTLPYPINKCVFSTAPSRKESDLIGEWEISDNALAFLQSLEKSNKALMDEILTAARLIGAD